MKQYLLRYSIPKCSNVESGTLWEFEVKQATTEGAWGWLDFDWDTIDTDGAKRQIEWWKKIEHVEQWSTSQMDRSEVIIDRDDLEWHMICWPDMWR